jgi:hypothetical protein
MTPRRTMRPALSGGYTRVQASIPARGGAFSRPAAANLPPSQQRLAAVALRSSPLDIAITGLMLCAVIVTFTISSSMLTTWHIHYLTSGGSFIEKLHPATYLTFAAFGLLLIRHGNPIGELNRILSDAKLLFLYFFCWLFLLVQVVVLDRPFTVIIDTFLLPVVLCLVIWQLSPSQRRPLVFAFHATMLLNVALGYFEYATGHRLFPLTLGSVLVVGEWRSAALLGHPLTASGIVAGYIMALLLRPQICPPPALRLSIITVCLGSMMAFGGRTALISVLVVIGTILLLAVQRLLQGGRTPLLNVILAMCALFALGIGIFLALDLGIFDKMLLRFSSDKGSTLARYATFSFLSHFDWHELIFGPNPMRVNALQTQMGLNYGIENFWISCIAQFGLVHTILLTIGLTAFFVEMLRRSNRAAWAITLLILTIAMSSVSFSSKNIQLAQFIFLVTLLLPRRSVHRTAQSSSNSGSVASPTRQYQVRNIA